MEEDILERAKRKMVLDHLVIQARGERPPLPSRARLSPHPAGPACLVPPPPNPPCRNLYPRSPLVLPLLHLKPELQPHLTRPNL